MLLAVIGRLTRTEFAGAAVVPVTVAVPLRLNCALPVTCSTVPFALLARTPTPLALSPNTPVNNNHPGAASFISGGIVMASTKASGGANPTRNTVVDNTLDNNKPADIVSDGTGTGNRITENECDTSLPPNMGFCSG